jgi:hypothetical protein
LAWPRRSCRLACTIARIDAPQFFLMGSNEVLGVWNSVESVEDLIARITAAAEYIQYSTQLTRTCSVAANRVTKLVAVTSGSSCDQPFYIVWLAAPRGCISGYGLSCKNDHPWPPLHTLKVCNIGSLTPCILCKTVIYLQFGAMICNVFHSIFSVVIITTSEYLRVCCHGSVYHNTRKWTVSIDQNRFLCHHFRERLVLREVMRSSVRVRIMYRMQRKTVFLSIKNVKKTWA